MTPELREGLKQSVWVLAQTTKASRDSMPELMDLIQTLLTGHKWRTFGGEENVKMNLKVWCEAVGDLPLYAVSKAVRWSILGEAKEPSVAEFVRSVRLACGHHVPERKRELLRLTGGKNQ
jgi:membrane protein required for beta-lactamase induction